MLKSYGLVSLLLLSTASQAAIQRVYCPKPTASFATEEETNNYLNYNKIRFLNREKVSEGDLQDFLGSFVRFPKSLQQNIIDAGGSIILINGEGVNEDPMWDVEKNKADPSKRSEWEVTVEGKRAWDMVRGSGGSPKFNIPTRIVVNHLHDGHGAIDLFVHEHAHTLDAIYGDDTISKSSSWLSVIAAEPKYSEVVKAICADDYCLNYPREAFAELFANYHSCKESRDLVERELPGVADFFKNLTNAEVFKSKSTPAPAVVTPQRQETKHERKGPGVDDVLDKAEDLAGQAVNQARRIFGRVFGGKPKPQE